MRVSRRKRKGLVVWSALEAPSTTSHASYAPLGDRDYGPVMALLLSWMLSLTGNVMLATYVQRPGVVAVVLDGDDTGVTAIIQVHERLGVQTLVVEERTTVAAFGNRRDRI